MRYLTLAEVVPLHRRLLQATGGAPGIREFRAPESAVAQPRLPLATGRLDPSQLTDWLRQHLKALE
jgi:prophage maintenance system killer protein